MAEQALTKNDILGFLHEHHAELKALGVQRLGLFGSYVRDEAGPDSDIDFLLTMDNLTYRKWMQVWNFLEDRLGREVDVVPEDGLREELRPYVLREVVYAEDD